MFAPGLGVVLQLPGHDGFEQGAVACEPVAQVRDGSRERRFLQALLPELEAEVVHVAHVCIVRVVIVGAVHEEHHVRIEVEQFALQVGGVLEHLVAGHRRVDHLEAQGIVVGVQRALEHGIDGLRVAQVLHGEGLGAADAVRSASAQEEDAVHARRLGALHLGASAEPLPIDGHAIRTVGLWAFAVTGHMLVHPVAVEPEFSLGTLVQHPGQVPAAREFQRGKADDRKEQGADQAGPPPPPGDFVIAHARGPR